MPRKLSLHKDVLVELTAVEAARVAGGQSGPTNCGGDLQSCLVPCLDPVIGPTAYECLTIHAGCSHYCTG